MEITFISDTHNKHDQISVGSGDMIIHSGDATSRGTDYEIEMFFKWFAAQDFKHKIFVPGNHDLTIEAIPEEYMKECNALGIHMLIDRSVTIDGIKIWGSPVTPWFGDWAWNRARNGTEAALYNCDFIFPHWDKIPWDTDILVTHGPPYGILDELHTIYGMPKGQFVGCEDLLKKVKEVKPKIHSFGHIHCAHGTLEQDGTLFINAANLDELYSYSYKPTSCNWNNGKPKLN